MNIVRELRIKKGIQQKELALELGVSSAAVSNWEKGKSDPSGERLQKLAEIFAVNRRVVCSSPTWGARKEPVILNDHRLFSLPYGMSKIDLKFQYVQIW